jgi:hypothetical protein
LEEIIFENFNISEHSIISVELAKVLGYLARNIPPPSSSLNNFFNLCAITSQSKNIKILNFYVLLEFEGLRLLGHRWCRIESLQSAYFHPPWLDCVLW